MPLNASQTATRPVTADVPAWWLKLWPIAAALAFLVAFGTVSWLVSSALGGVYGAAEWLTTRGHVPVPALFAAPLVLIGVLGVIGRRRRESRRTTPQYESDPTWYRGRTTDPADSSGIPFELEGGPLHGRVGRLRDSRFSLWVTRLADGRHIFKCDLTRPATLPSGATFVGAYVFSEDAEALAWTPAAALAAQS